MKDTEHARAPERVEGYIVAVPTTISAEPTPLVVAPRAGHVVAPCDFLNSYSALRAVREITLFEPVTHLFGQELFALLALVLSPRLLALATELEAAVGAGVHPGFVLVTLCDLVASGVGTVSSFRVGHDVQVLLEALILLELLR